MKKILLTGKDGQVGWELQRSLASLGNVWAFDRQSLDLCNPDAIVKVVREINPDLIINAAAYTAVDKAEQEQDIAYAINGVAPGIFAEESKKCGALFIHYSTDYVFDGSAKQPYRENDATSPLNIYGQTKLQGENAVQAVCGRHLILRTSWVYGMRGKNFLLTMLRLGNERDSLNIVDDQVGAPTWSRSIALATSQMVLQTMLQDDLDISGIYHLTSAGQTSWFGFAEEIFRLQKEKSSRSIPTLRAISTADYPLPAARPSYSVLSNDKLAKVFQLRLPDWKECLHTCMNGD